MIIYSVEIFPDTIEFEEDQLGDAIDRAEMYPHATLIKWYVENNLPGLLPKKVWKSLRMYSWKDKEWWAIAIHGPELGQWKERPDEA